MRLEFSPTISQPAEPSRIRRPILPVQDHSSWGASGSCRKLITIDWPIAVMQFRSLFDTIIAATTLNEINRFQATNVPVVCCCCETMKRLLTTAEMNVVGPFSTCICKFNQKLSRDLLKTTETINVLCLIRAVWTRYSLL